MLGKMQKSFERSEPAVHPFSAVNSPFFLPANKPAPLVQNVYLLYTSHRCKFSQVVSPSCRNFSGINPIGAKESYVPATTHERELPGGSGRGYAQLTAVFSGHYLRMAARHVRRVQLRWQGYGGAGTA